MELFMEVLLTAATVEVETENGRAGGEERL